MVLQMARPFKHPKTGVYYLRKRVPTDLVSLVGRQVEKRTLGTKDPSEARNRHAVALAELASRWSNLRRPVLRPLPLEINAYAGDFYRTQMRDYDEGRGSFFFTTAIMTPASEFVEGPNDPQARAGFRHAFGDRIDAYLSDKGLRIDPAFQGAVDLAIARAVLHAGEKGLKMMLEGDFSLDPNAARYPEPPRPAHSFSVDASHDMKHLALHAQFETYCDASKLAASTRKRWGLALRTLETHVGHDDIRRVTKKDVGSWIALLETERSPRTVRDVHLSALKALLNWLVGKQLLEDNVAAGFRIKVPKEKILRTRNLTDDEARIILRATLEPQSAKLGPKHAAARRWVPWLCAYTGARVNEMTQLRRQDVFQVAGIWMLKITPDAGTVKDNQFRDVPIHAHLIEQGFLTFVNLSRAGPLFYAVGKATGKNPANPPYKKIGERLARWVRALGVTDPGVDPNHGWRHRFKTIGLRVGMTERILDGMQGHAPRTEGEKYGDIEPGAKLAQLEKFPRIMLTPDKDQ